MISAMGVNVNIWRGGQGEPLFVLTGWNGTFAANEEMLHSLAGENFSVYGIELPGTGKSDSPCKNWVFADYVPLIDAILTHYGLLQGIVLGHSFGCVAALKFARYFPHRIKRLVLCNSPCLSPKKFLGIGIIFPLVFFLVTMLVAFPCWMISRAMPCSGGMIFGLIRRFGMQYPYLTRCGGVMRKVLRIVIDDNTLEDARNVKVPALIVGSERGGITPLSNSISLHGALTGSDFAVIPGAPHDFRGIWAERFSKIVRDWATSKEPVEFYKL